MEFREDEEMTRVTGAEPNSISGSTCMLLEKARELLRGNKRKRCSSSSVNSPSCENSDKISIGYLSDGLLGRAQERKKGVTWTEEEHRSFLTGLEKLGKGDWRGISRNFVTTRTPTQVASHARKYFLRQASRNKKKRPSSLFDMIGSKNTTAHHQVFNLNPLETNDDAISANGLSSKASSNLDHAAAPLLDLNTFAVDTKTNNQDCMKSQGDPRMKRMLLLELDEEVMKPSDDAQTVEQNRTSLLSSSLKAKSYNLSERIEEEPREKEHSYHNDKEVDTNHEDQKNVGHEENGVSRVKAA